MSEQPETEARSFGRYELVHALGQGGMGEVYLAKITGAAGFEKPCIVKTILPSLLSDRQFLDRFHHEAKVLVHLVHSNIAQIYDMGEAEGSYFMALEYVAGVDLSQLMEEVRHTGAQIPVPVALYIGARIAEGLGYAHRRTAPDGTPLGIVHRDISPHNVMVGYEGEVKVIDFGLARSAARSRHTMPSTVMGKLGYMAPEQARAEQVDHRADIYSCGLVIWELLAGRPAFATGTVGEMMAAMSNPKLPSLSELRPEVDPALEAVVAHAVAVDPNQRYARADELARKLSEQLIKLGTPVDAEEVGQYVRTTCPEAFAAQRRLISKLSTVGPLKKRSPIPLTAMSPRPAPSDEEAFAATHVRSVSGAQQAQRPSRAPWVIAGLSLLLLAAGGGLMAWPLLRPKLVPPERVAAAPVIELPAPTPVVVPEKVVEEPPVVAEPAPAPPPAAPAPQSAEVHAVRKTSAPVEWISNARVAELISDRSGVFARAGDAEGLAPGAVLKVVGKPERGGKRRLFGTATVLEVHPNLSRIAFDDAAKMARGKKFLALPPAPRAPKAALPALALPAGAQRPSPATRPVVALTPTVAAPAPQPRKLFGRITVGGALSRYIVVHNADVSAWTDCMLFIREDGKYPAKYAAGAPIPKGGTREVPLNKFRRDPSARIVGRNVVGITCDEGSVDLPVRW